MWIEYDQEPPPGIGLFGVWRQTPPNALAAIAARWAHPTAGKDELLISTCDGFGAKSLRPPRASDHTPDTLKLAQHALEGKRPMPSAVFIAGLSTLYERALAQAAGNTPQEWVAKAVLDLVPAFAGSALTHMMYDLRSTGVPVIATCWGETKAKRFSPYVPRGVTNVADLVITDFRDLDAIKELTRAI